MPPSRFELTTPGLWDQRVANELNVTRDAQAKKLVVSWNDSMSCLLDSNDKPITSFVFINSSYSWEVQISNKKNRQ